MRCRLESIQFGWAGCLAVVLVLAAGGCKDAKKDGASPEPVTSTCTAEQLCDIGTKCGGFPNKETCIQKSKEATDSCTQKTPYTKCACDCYAKASPTSDCAVWQQCAGACFKTHCGGSP